MLCNGAIMCLFVCICTCCARNWLMAHGQKGPWKKHNLIPQTIIGSEPEDARPFVQLRYVLVKRSDS